MVLQITASDKPDSWYHEELVILQKLVRKGLITDETELHDALHPIFERLHACSLFPKKMTSNKAIWGVPQFIYTSIGDGLRNNSTLHSTLQMLKSIVQCYPRAC